MASLLPVRGANTLGTTNLRIAAALLAGLGLGGTARAGNLDFGHGVALDYKLTMNYGLAIRTEGQSDQLINGPLDPFKVVSPPPFGGGLFIVTHTGLPQTVGSDDSDRNFKQWSLIHNRLSALLETQLTWENYGAVVSSDGFYDQVYHHPNDNNSDALATPTAPSTANVVGPANRFTDATRHYDGNRFRMLDSYVFGDWNLGNSARLDLRAGKQLVAWGESLFFSGVASAQGPADATKAFVPGSEIKEILLPVNQIAGSLTLGASWTLLAQYKLQFKPNEIFPEGDYFSPSDAVGPGASFVVGSANPLFLLNGIGGGLITAGPTVNIPRVADAVPSDYGQYSLGVKFQATPTTTLGAYWLRYHDTNPSVMQNVNYIHFGDLHIGGNTVPLTSHIPGIIDEPAPSQYYVRYFDGIDMAALSFSTGLGGVNVAGEVSLRRNLSIPVQAVELGQLAPMFQRGKLGQVLVSAIYATNPHLWFDDMSLVGEAGYVHVLNVNPASNVYSADPTVSHIPGIVPIGDGKALFYDKDSFGFEGLIIPTRHGVFSGWDLSVPINFGGIFKGNPSMPGAFGAYAGEGDYRFSLGANMQYLQNLQLGIGYNFFFGNPGKNVGSSFVKQNPYTDRDYATLNIKYNF